MVRQRLWKMCYPIPSLRGLIWPWISDSNSDFENWRFEYDISQGMNSNIKFRLNSGLKFMTKSTLGVTDTLEYKAKTKLTKMPDFKMLPDFSIDRESLRATDILFILFNWKHYDLNWSERIFSIEWSIDFIFFYFLQNSRLYFLNFHIKTKKINCVLIEIAENREKMDKNRIKSDF